MNGLTLSNPNVFISATVLKIPTQQAGQQTNAPQVSRQHLISQFVAQFKCSNFEAKQYLEENEYDLEKAINSRNEKIKPKEEGEAPTRVGGLTIHNVKLVIQRIIIL